MKTLGIVILLLGFIMTIVTGFTIINRKDVDLGHVEFQVKADRTPIYWSPITGAALIVAGTAFVSGSRVRKVRRR